MGRTRGTKFTATGFETPDLGFILVQDFKNRQNLISGAAREARQKRFPFGALIGSARGGRNRRNYKS